jgi:hypothetical protein
MARVSRPTSKGRRKRVVAKRQALRRKPEAVPASVHRKLERIQQSPLVIRFVNRNELFQMLGKGKVQGREAHYLHMTFPEILEQKNIRGKWKGKIEGEADWRDYVGARTDYYYSLVKMSFEQFATEILIKSKKKAKNKKELWIDFQKGLLELTNSGKFHFEKAMTFDSLKEKTDHINKVFPNDSPKEKIDYFKRKFFGKSIFRSQNFGDRLKLNFSLREIDLMLDLLFDHEFLAKNPGKYKQAVKTMSKMQSIDYLGKNYYDKGRRDFLFDIAKQYELMLIFDPEVTHTNMFSSVPDKNASLSPGLKKERWIDMINDVKPSHCLGVLVMTKESKEFMGKILTLTAKHPERRMPIFNSAGVQIWPPKKKKKTS